MADSPFASKSVITLRSPRLDDKSPKTVMSSLDDNECLKKRKYNDINGNDIMEYENSNDENETPISLKDIYDLINAKSAEDSRERLSIKNEITNEIKQINEKIVSIEHKVNKIEKKVDAVSLLAQQNKKIINSLCQEKMDNCMEIDGIQKKVIDECKDLKNLVIETIRSYKIDIAELDVERVTRKDFQQKDKNEKVTNRTVLSVRFREFETKLKVLREKRPKNIFQCIAYFFQSIYYE